MFFKFRTKEDGESIKEKKEEGKFKIYLMKLRKGIF